MAFCTEELFFPFYLWSQYSGTAGKEMMIFDDLMFTSKMLTSSFYKKKRRKCRRIYEQNFDYMHMSTCIGFCFTYNQRCSAWPNNRLKERILNSPNICRIMLLGPFSIFHLMLPKKLALSICQQYQHDQFGTEKICFSVQLNCFIF